MARDDARKLRKTLLTVWPLLATVACLLALSWWAVGMLVAARAWVAGESIWSKAEKDAAIHLVRYAREGQEGDFAAYNDAIAPIAGDRKGRLALLQTPPDIALAREGFREGRNAPDDVDAIINLFLRFHETRLMVPAIKAWTEADELVLELNETALAIRRERASPTPSAEELQRLEGVIADLNVRMTPLEQHFSDTIGAGFRGLADLLRLTMLAATLVLGSLGLVLVHRVLLAAERTREERDALQADVRRTFELTQSLNRAALLEEVYSPALDALLEALGVDHVALLLVDPDRVMRFKAWRGFSDGFRDVLDGFTPWPLTETEPSPILIVDTESEPSVAFREALQNERIRSLVYMPLVHQDALVGMFSVASQEPRSFSVRDERLLATVAAQVVVAISRTRLFESERVLAREYAQLYERERQAVSARDQFIAIASHELRTPLTALKLNAQLVDRINLTTQGQLVRATVEKLRSNIARLERLVAQLLDVSRISAGKFLLKREPTELGAVIRAVVDRAQLELSSTGSIVEIEADGPVAGSWDQDRLDQVATNLLHNAIKYGRGLPITMRVERADSTASLIVRDHGLGIAQEDQRRIFERFERAVSVHNFGGFGLGLWIVRAIVEAHGGKIAVTSTPGEGAEFRVELPLAEATDGEASVE